MMMMMMMIVMMVMAMAKKCKVQDKIEIGAAKHVFDEELTIKIHF